MLLTAPLLLLGRPPRLPVKRAISTVEGINRTLDWLLGWLWWALDVASRTTSHRLVQRPVVLVGVDLNEALVARPTDVAEQPQEQKQQARCGTDDEAADVGAPANTVVATIPDVMHFWLHRKLAAAVAYIHQVTIARLTSVSVAIHVARNFRRAHAAGQTRP